MIDGSNAGQTLTCERRALDLLRNREIQLEKRTLYHYTSPEGLLGILTGQRVRATHVAYLNDSLEIEYGLSLLEEVLWEMPTIREHSYELARVIQDSDHNLEAYVACFSTEPDVLSQWRAYANDGLGYSVGFRAATKFSTDGGQQVEILAIEYEDAVQRDIIRGLVLPELEGHDLSNHHVVKQVGEQIALGLRHILPILKNPGFSEESERRAILKFSTNHRPKPTGFRATRFGVTPFIEMRTHELVGERLEIEEVWLGPKLNRHHEMRAVEELLNAHGYRSELQFRFLPGLATSGAVLVKTSAVSYR